MEAGVKLFVMIGRHPHARLAKNFVHSLSRVEKRVREVEDPFIARLYMAPDADFEEGRSGEVRLWLTRAEWLGKGSG